MAIGEGSLMTTNLQLSDIHYGSRAVYYAGLSMRRLRPSRVFARSALFTFLFLSAYLGASDLSNFGGVVLDARTQTPVPSARVILEIWSKDEPQTTFTNSSGVFSFTVSVGEKAWPGRILIYDPNHIRLERAVQVSSESKPEGVILQPLYVSSTQAERRIVMSPLIQSFPGASWSPWIDVCAYAGPNEKIGGVVQFRLVGGDRSCGAWSECRERIHDSQNICWQFRVQGHDEWRGPFGVTLNRSGPPNQGILEYEVLRTVEAPPQEGQSGTVAIHFSGMENAQIVETLGTLLAKSGFRVLNIERIDKRYGSSVKYFHDDDKPVAEQVQAVAKATLAGRQTISLPVLDGVKGLENKARLKYVEVWLH